MQIEETAQAALTSTPLDLPSAPSVEGIEVEHYEDSTGESSLEVWVILSDSTADDDLTGEHVMQIKSAIRERLLSNDIRLFPYVRLIKRSDYEAETART